MLKKKKEKNSLLYIKKYKIANNKELYQNIYNIFCQQWKYLQYDFFFFYIC